MLAQFGADVDFLHDGYSHSKEIEDTFFCAGNQMEQAEWVVQVTHSAAWLPGARPCSIAARRNA
jgi:hypothetical protein